MSTETKISAAAQAAATAAKENGYDVEFVLIAGKEYVYRPIVRSEWRKLMKERNELMAALEEDKLAQAEALESEYEKILSLCLLYSSVPMANIPAGAVQTLGDAILSLSGFGGLDMTPIKL